MAINGREEGVDGDGAGEVAQCGGVAWVNGGQGGVWQDWVLAWVGGQNITHPLQLPSSPGAAQSPFIILLHVVWKYLLRCSSTRLYIYTGHIQVRKMVYVNIFHIMGQRFMCVPIRPAWKRYAAGFMHTKPYLHRGQRRQPTGSRKYYLLLCGERFVCITFHYQRLIYTGKCIQFAVSSIAVWLWRLSGKVYNTS